MSLRNRASADVESPTVPLASPGDSLCGYRLVRKLGDGPRAEVFLGFGEGSDESEGPTAAVKVCRPSASASSTTELEALARAQHQHVVRLVDAATSPDGGGACLVLERLSRGSLAHLLERRETLLAGEVVTILAPLARAIDDMHASGVIHGAIGAGAVLFRDSGAPVLARFGRAALIQPHLAPALLAPLAADDRAALAELVSLLLARVDDERAAELVGWVHAASWRDGFGALLADQLFAFSPAAPVAFEQARSYGSAVPERIGVRRAEHRAQTSRPQRQRPIRPQLPESVVAFVRSLRVVRTPVWVGAASVLVAIIAAFVLAPGGASDVPANAKGLPTASATIAPAAKEETSPTAVADPVAALAALVVARRKCMDDLSVLCLDDVDQPGSAALDDDADLIRGVRAGGELPESTRLGAVSPKLAERLGDSALIDLEGDGKPASVLVIRTEAGWRIRDYLD